MMLQQTQAARVVPYYEAFLATFPDPVALAAASTRTLLERWSGLGYNRRALALREAARVIAADGWPAPDRLAQLPGVGPYTAAAVASFAWDVPVAAVDTNVRRVIARWDGTERPPAPLAARATALLPPGRAAEWNQAMIELGARVCVARRPRCDRCPVREGCRTGSATEAVGGTVGADGARTGRSAAGSATARRPRFEDTDRWARGRTLAALLSGTPPPELAPERRERVLAGLERDGLVVRGPDGTPSVA